MPIKPGDRIPSLSLKRWTDGSMQEVKTDDLFKGHVILFGVPGAFTPTCSMKHLPSYLDNMNAFKAKGIDRIVCMAVNDPFVMAAWAKANNVNGAIDILPDGNGDLTRAMSIDMDAKGYNMGTRCHRFAMYVKDGVVKSVHIEAPGAFEVSGGDAMLKQLPLDLKTT